MEEDNGKESKESTMMKTKDQLEEKQEEEICGQETTNHIF